MSSVKKAINAWSKCRRHGKAKRAKAILDQMVADYENGNKNAKPNVFAYTAVVSCSTSQIE